MSILWKLRIVAKLHGVELQHLKTTRGKMEQKPWRGYVPSNIFQKSDL